MSNKYYKIRVDDLFNINYYGIKADNNTPAHPQNFKSLEYLYKIRYPKLMEKADNLAYMNYAVKEQNEISKGEMDKYNVPYYLLVTDTWSNGFFEYKELLTGLPILIPSEIYAKSSGYPLKLREEITPKELDDLFNDDYIRRISNLFGILLKDEEKNNIRCQILKK